MSTALWLAWEALRALGVPLIVGYFFGRYTQRKDYQRAEGRGESHANPTTQTRPHR
jgi:hypothetical protein